MGDPKKQRKKYQRPGHPWQKERLDEEAVLVKEYGLKNKKEVWRSEAKLKHSFGIAKQYVRASGADAEKESAEFVGRLFAQGVLPAGATINDVLTLTLRNFLERRLQTQVVRLGLARSVKQARQFITHGHIIVAGTKVTVPSYMVSREEENSVVFADNSNLSNEEHPERVQPEPLVAEAAPEAKEEKADKKEKKAKAPKKDAKKADKKEAKADKKSEE